MELKMKNYLGYRSNMNIALLNQLQERYRNLAAPLKASFWFLVCSIMMKCFAMISTPIFTRLLTVEQYGKTANFYSWYDLLYPFVTLYLSGVAYNNILVKYENEREKAALSLMTLASLVTCVFFIVYIIFQDFFNKVFEISTGMMIIMFVELLFVPIFDFWSAKERYDYKYKKLVAISLISTFLGLTLGVIGVLLCEEKYEVKIASKIFVTAIIGLVIYINVLNKSSRTIDTKYWKYALIISLPLIPHYLSMKVLNQVDRVMITKMVGIEETGMYSLAYTVASLTLIFTDAINRSMCPYVYKSIKNKNIKGISRLTDSILVLVLLLSFLEMLIAPELIQIFATEKYLGAIYIIPPIAISVYFIFVYVIFANIEFYFEKTKFATVVSVIAAISNIILNWICIKLFGYYAAGFTTLVCYILFALLHYYNFNNIIRRNKELANVFNVKHILNISLVGLLIMFLCLILYNYTIIRYSVIAVLVILAFVYRQPIIKTLSLKK